MKYWMMVMLALAAACGDNGSSGIPFDGGEIWGDARTLVCDPGRSEACTGPGGCEGGQVCDANGLGYGPCECGAPVDDLGMPQEDAQTPSEDMGAPVDMGTPSEDLGSPDTGPEDMGGPSCTCVDDGNPCTNQRCEGSTCVVEDKPDGLLCNGTLGRCLGGACCEGCIDGSTCRMGDTVSDCGARGETCENCAGLATECEVPECNTAGDCNLIRVVDGTSCDGGAGVCDRGVCEACGGPGQECCASDSCDSGAICISNECEACGNEGQPCCDSFTCGSSDLRCDTSDVPSGGVGECVPCGGQNERCCLGTDTCGASLECRGPGGLANGDFCECGFSGGPCCPSSIQSCSGDGSACPTTGICGGGACQGSPGSQTCA